MAPAIVFTGGVYVLVNSSLAAKVTHANFIVRGLGEPVLLMAAGLGAAVVRPPLIQLATAHVLAAAGTFLVAVFVVGRVFGRGEIARAVGSPLAGGFPRFSIPLGAAELMNTILQRADIILLTAFVGPSDRGLRGGRVHQPRHRQRALRVRRRSPRRCSPRRCTSGQHERLHQNLLLMSRWVATAAAPDRGDGGGAAPRTAVAVRPAFRAGRRAHRAGEVTSSTRSSAWRLHTAGPGRSRSCSWPTTWPSRSSTSALGLILIPASGMGAAIASLAGVILLHTLVTIQVRLAYGVYPFSWSILKPLAAAAVMLGVEMGVNWSSSPARS